MILRYSCTSKRCIQIALLVRQLAQNLYPLSCMRATVSHGPAQEMGKAMQLSTRIKSKARRSRIHWVGTLSASVASFLAGARSKPQPDLATTKHSQVFYQRGVSPSAAPDFGMLVESDVSKKGSGMVS